MTNMRAIEVKDNDLHLLRQLAHSKINRILLLLWSYISFGDISTLSLSLSLSLSLLLHGGCPFATNEVQTIRASLYTI